MDIQAGVWTAVALAVLFAGWSIWAGLNVLRDARRMTYFLLRRKRIASGWRSIAFGVLLLGFAFVLGRWGEPVAYSYYPPSPTITVSPTISPTPTITLTPSITVPPTLTNTPSITDTPTITPTPFVPLAIEALFTSVVTPNPAAIFSPLQFSEDVDNAAQPINPGVVFSNPIERIYATYSYDQMAPESQWTALWYRGNELVFYETGPFTGGTGGFGTALYEPPQEEWLPGTYTVQIFAGLEWKAVGQFILEGDPPTPTATRTPTETREPTIPPTPSNTPRPTWTVGPSRTPTSPPARWTVAPSQTPTQPPATWTVAPSQTPTAPQPTWTVRPSLTPTVTNTRWPSQTPTITQTPTPTRTITPTNTRWPSQTPTATRTPTP